MTQPADPFEFMKSLWAPMGLPMAGMFAPTLNLSEIDKRIAELRSVENWLNLNLGALRMTIQGLEMQRATLAAMQSAMSETAKPEPSSGPGEPAAQAPASDPGRAFAEAWWKMLQQQARPPDEPGKK